MRIKRRGEERDGHGGERRRNKEPLAVCLSLLSNAKERKKTTKKTSTWAEVQLLASVWRFITLQREREVGEEEGSKGWSGGGGGSATEGSEKRGLIVCECRGGGKEKRKTGRARAAVRRGESREEGEEEEGVEEEGWSGGAGPR